MMNRRTFLAGTGAVLLAEPLAAEAQPERKAPKIGVLKIFTPVSSTWPPASFWDRIRELGWAGGQNLAVERRDAAGNWQRLPTLAGELMRLKVDVIVMDAGNAAKRVQESTRPTPICVTGGDLQASGVVKNLARPEGHGRSARSTRLMSPVY
jgi:putative ABC transport system substrate-binding protein